MPENENFIQHSLSLDSEIFSGAKEIGLYWYFEYIYNGLIRICRFYSLENLGFTILISL